MSDTGDMYRAMREDKKRRREELGVPCPVCKVKLPKAHPKILLPGQKCWCGYRDKRELS